MAALYHNLYRFQVTQETVEKARAMCSPSGSFSWVGRTGTGQRLRIHTLRGVPGKHVDILISDTPYPNGEYHFLHHRTGESLREPGRWLLVCDIGRKEGRYDGAERWRITFRTLTPSMHPENDPPSGRLFFDEDGEGMHVVASWGKGECWGWLFPQLRYEVDERTDFAGILIKQASLYFSFLQDEGRRDRGTWLEVRALAESWASIPDTREIRDINALNRSASNALYALAKSLGWRKLTLSQRRRLGLPDDSGCWQREERIAYLSERIAGTQSGVGRYTLDAANGAVIALPRGVCPQCNELEHDCECQP